MGPHQGLLPCSAGTLTGTRRLEIVKRNDLPRFEVLLKRWIVKRSFAWMGRCRTLAKDFEHKIRFAGAFLIRAMIKIMLRRIARHQL